MNRRTSRGFKQYWERFPYHFQEIYRVPATSEHIKEAYGKIIEQGMQKMIREWAEEAHDLAGTWDAMKSPFYSINHPTVERMTK
jgi:hypothetical protein